MSAYQCIELLWNEGFFKKGRNLRATESRIIDKWGHHYSVSDISTALSRFKNLRRTGRRGSYIYIQRISPVTKKIESVEENLFAPELKESMKKDFKTELNDLHMNFGHSGTCIAFLLRKILEKLIYLVFAKNNIVAKIEDPVRPGRLLGLEKMVNAASQEKISGLPLLTPHTALKINGIKFLGDISAHNPVINVDMETIIPQMPFIITAYKELAARL